MTTLFLDVPQRVNIVAMLDALECGGRREAYAVCKLQDQINLSDAEKNAINWRKVSSPDGREYATWTMNEAATKHEMFEIADDDVSRLSRAVDQFRMVPGRDRVWYEPLVAQLPAPAEPAAAAAAR
jgi:hypothetical protein